MDYDFRRLGPQNFEKLVQALVVAEYGSKAHIYGRGRDGGRDAVVRRYEFNDFNKTDVHVGEAYFQAKHVDIAQSEGTQAAAAFQKALRKEIDTWRDRAKWTDGVARCLVFATNAVLSPVERVGQIDKLASQEKDLLAGTQFRAIEYWHYDRLCSLLDVHEGVRIVYEPLMLPSDQIASRGRKASDQVVRANRVLRTALENDLRDERFMTLGEVDDRDEQPLAIGHVFIDVPYAATGAKSGATVLADLIATEDAIQPAAGADQAIRRLVIVGGPGQGKTTVGRFVAQIYRRAIFASEDARRPTGVTKEVCDDVDAALKRTALSLPQYRRWPLRIELASYAQELRRNPSRAESDGQQATEGLTLSRYLEDQFNRFSEQKLDRDDLWEWMERWPTLLILDGMDETPGDLRAEIVKQIERFEIHALNSGVRLLLIITTRPQGGGTDFDPKHYDHWRLKTLEPRVASEYAGTLVRLRFKRQPKMLATMNLRVEKALSGSATSKLMTTPLQVAIMTTILEREAELRQSRFELFDDYFRAVYRREAAKTGQIGDVLRKEQKLIESVHHRAALMLHSRAESGTDFDPLLENIELSRLIEKVVVTSGVKKNVRARVKRIEEAVTDRLVLLVAARESTWQFEVRSLQEYMAARALTVEELTKPQAVKILGAMASSTHWRNVWLLAAGSAFSATLGFKEVVVSIVAGLNSSNPLLQVARPAAALAADLLADEVAANFPVHRRAFVQPAFDLNSASNADDAKRLANALGFAQHDPEVLDTIRVELNNIGLQPERLSQMRVLVRLLANQSGPLASHAMRLLDGVGRLKAVTTIRLHTSPRELENIAAGLEAIEGFTPDRDETAALTRLSKIVAHALAHNASIQVTDIVLTVALSQALASPQFVRGLASMLTRAMADPGFDVGRLPKMLADAEARRDRSKAVRAAGEGYLLDEW